MVEAREAGMTRYCSACGAPLKDGSRFCTACGAPVAADAPAAGPAASPAVNSAGSTRPSPAFAAASQPATAPAQPVAAPAPARSNKPVIIAVAAASVAAILFIGAAVFVLKPFGSAGAAKGSSAVAAASADAGSSDAGSTSIESTSSKPSAAKVPDKTVEDSDSDASSSARGSSASSPSPSAQSSPSTQQPMPSNDSPSGQQAGGSYILPESATRVYSVDELSVLSTWQLMMARNEIYARHGRGFNDDEIRSYFQNQPWYHQLYTAEEFDAGHTGELSGVEQQNIANILSVENAR